MEEFCCEEMGFFVSNGEIGLIYVDMYREYGLEYRDGGSSFQLINFRPWCGAKLPCSLREEWFNRLNSLGISDPFMSKIPIQHETSEWWKS